MRAIWGVVAASVLASAVPDAAWAQDRFILLATNRTGTMEDELNAAGADGYRFIGTQGGETAFGGSEVVVIMERDPEGRRYRYMLLATSRTGTMEQELNSVPPEFEVVGMTVFESTFGGDESAVILQAEASAFATTTNSSSATASGGRPDAPIARESSIYLVAEDGSRQLVAPSAVRRIEEEGGGLFSRSKLFAILAGLDAPTRTSDHYQTFDFETADRGAIDELVLVRFYEEADYGERTFDVLPGGVNLEAVIPLSTELLDDGMYRLRPAEPLGLGEFGFIRLETGEDITRGLTVHDFGVEP